jgi:ArsR family transcriptional regulator, arsenate/arsenite/antimonite-responsive transcriptional repressor
MAEQAAQTTHDGTRNGHLLGGKSAIPVETGHASTGRRSIGDGRQMTKVFKALSDGTRQEILRLLEGDQHTVGEIVRNFHLSQPTISRHLSVLKEADLVVDQRQGQNVIYRLNPHALSSSMRDFFGQFRSCQSELR